MQHAPPITFYLLSIFPPEPMIVSMSILTSVWLQVTGDTTPLSLTTQFNYPPAAGAGLGWAGSHFKENTHQQFNDR